MYSASVYHAISPAQVAWGLIVILMTAVLLLGLVSRQKYGLGRIGFESGDGGSARQAQTTIGRAGQGSN